MLKLNERDLSVFVRNGSQSTNIRKLSLRSVNVQTCKPARALEFQPRATRCYPPLVKHHTLKHDACKVVFIDIATFVSDVMSCFRLLYLLLIIIHFLYLYLVEFGSVLTF